MKLLFVTAYVDHILHYFLLELGKRVALRVVYQLESRWTAELAALGVKIERAVPGSRFDKRFQGVLERLYVDEPFDLVHCFHGNPQLSNAILWNRRRVPLAGYRARIGHLKFRESPAAFWSVRNPNVDATAAVSTAVKDYLDSFKVLRPKNVRVIAHGTDVGWTQSKCREPYGLREKLGIPAEAFVALSVASLRPVKRFDVIVAAARALRNHGIHFVNVGDPLRWKSKARHLENVHFIDYDPNVFPIVAEADVYVSACDREAFGRANLDAMACGKPFVGPRAGGALDLIADGVTGRFFEPRNALDLAEKVLWYREDPRRVADHSRNTLERVQEHFSTQTMVERYVELYEDVLAGELGSG